MPMEGIEDLYPLAPTQAGMVYHGLVDLTRVYTSGRSVFAWRV